MFHLFALSFKFSGPDAEIFTGIVEAGSQGNHGGYGPRGPEQSTLSHQELQQSIVTGIDSCGYDLSITHGPQ